MSTLPPSEIANEKAHITEDRGPQVVGVSSMLMGVAIVVVALRLYARFQRRLKLGADDYMAVGGLVLVILQTVINIISVQYGLGKHSIAVDPTVAYKILEAGLFNALVYGLVHFFIKMSILLFYRRIFTFNTPWFKIAVYTCMAYTTGWMLTVFFGGLFQCTPVSYFWEQFNISLQPPAKGFCGLDNAPFALWTSILNTIGDFVILFLPIAMLWQLQLAKARKISLIGVFATGILACAAGIVRLIQTETAIQPGSDTTWITADVYLWTQVEASVGLICACMPVIGPMFGPLKDKTKAYMSRRATSGKDISSDGSNWGKSQRSNVPNAFGTNASFGRLGSAVDRSTDEEEDKVQLRPMSPLGRIVRTDEVVLEHSKQQGRGRAF